MGIFGKNCSSDPTSGCGDGGNAALFAEIKQGNIEIENKLGDINNKLELLIGEQQDCCEETNGNLNDIKDRLGTLIEIGENCCDNILTRLDTIVGLMSAQEVVAHHLSWKNFVCAQVED